MTDMTKQVREQCKLIAHLAEAISEIHSNLAKMFDRPFPPDIAEMMGPRTAEYMEILGDMLDDMDCTPADYDDWMMPIFEEAQRLWPQAAQRAVTRSELRATIERLNAATEKSHDRN